MGMYLWSQLKVKFVPVYFVKANVRVEVELYTFSVSALHGGEFSASHLRRFILGVTAPGIHWLQSRSDLMEKRSISYTCL
jgi:hypothetical protein